MCFGTSAQVFYREMYLEKQLDPRFFSSPDPDEKNRPTLWYETSLEKVVWESYSRENKESKLCERPTTGHRPVA